MARRNMKLSSQDVEKAFLSIMLERKSLRAMARHFGVDVKTLWLRLKRQYGDKDYATVMHQSGVAAVLNEYARKGTPKQRKVASDWLEQNLQKVIASDLSANTQLLTFQEENALTIRQCYSELFLENNPLVAV